MALARLKFATWFAHQLIYSQRVPSFLVGKVKKTHKASRDGGKVQIRVDQVYWCAWHAEYVLGMRSLICDFELGSILLAVTVDDDG